MNTPQDNLYAPDPGMTENSGVNSMPSSDAKLKQFFLEEARMLYPATNTNCSEYSKIYALSQRLKRTVKLFNLLSGHHWGELFPDLQRAFCFYLLEGYASKKDRLRIVELLAKEAGFVTQTAHFYDFITLLQQFFSLQLEEIERILKIYYPPEKVNPFADQ